jgi:hypothetical protein
MSYFFGTRHPDRRAKAGVLRRVGTVTFCDMSRCSKLATWNIAYGSQSVSFCPRHTLVTMKDEAIWKGD